MNRRSTLVFGCVVVLLGLVLLVAGCGGSGSSGSEAADTSLAAATYEDTFGMPPTSCETGYGVWEEGLDFEEHDVTFCSDGGTIATGCYVTETGQDVTVAYRNVNDDTGLC